MRLYVSGLRFEGWISEVIGFVLKFEVGILRFD
jgi:hypothetical protein